MNGWIDTIISSTAVGLAATAPCVLVPARDWVVIGFTFLLAFSGAVAQHRRQPPRSTWSDEERAQKLNPKEPQ